ncbi:MAG: hypothetical protein KKH34_00415 [Candidatus Omnitrophica bacterium]|nr:hypothetical protein [Candidatus Omnitrophota bacterium]
MKKKRAVEYSLQEDGKFIIKNYDLAKPFASFFPGIAGLFGIPMWVFYVNRGQGIVSFGTEDKKHSILEFFPANRAWQFVSKRGFRTFLKIKSGEKVFCYEPFQNTQMSEKLDIERRMAISSGDFGICEDNRSAGIFVSVDYCTLPDEPLACLMRKVTIKNTSRSSKNIEMLDGLPQMVPYGVNDRFLKELGRTIEAWMKVDFVTKFRVPYYKLTVDPTDRPQVIYINGGNFYYNFSVKNSRMKKSAFIVDPNLVFGPVSDFNYPQRFFAERFSVPKEQVTCAKTSSAFGYTNFALKPGEEVCIVSLIGYAHDEKHLQEFIANTENIEFLDKKCSDYTGIIARLQNYIFTASPDNAYNLYCRQTYLDNVMRGGFPLTVKGNGKKHIVHIYSRRHGDLERDYNNFLTEAAYLSQGNGNYRDVNQNRRNDVWFNADVEDENVIAFFNLLQLDGFNPLIVFGDRFRLKDKVKFESCRGLFKKEADWQKVYGFIEKQFAAGGLFMFLEKNGIALKTTKEKFLVDVLSCCDKQENAEHGDGFWVDHWTYNIDALEAYLAIYPERLQDILIKTKRFVFFNNFVKVKPREDKYVLFEGRVRQYHAVSVEELEEDSELSKKISSADWAVRTEYGKAEVYKTTLLVKILCLIANKTASLDPSGSGIEMEANKPGWYDALNGLPGLFGSSVCETMELKRLIEFVLSALSAINVNEDDSAALPEELHLFLNDIDKLIVEYNQNTSDNRDMDYWDKSYALKEAYRRKIASGISGKELPLRYAELKSMLRRMEDKLTRGISRAYVARSGLFHTYYINEVVEFEKIKGENDNAVKMSADGLECVRPLRFEQKPLPLFLEAQVHALRIEPEQKKALAIYRNTKKSPLYDKKLKMYKVNAPLSKLSEEIGRARIFTPGWLENESIWLHMEYKFILELLRHGLYEEFFSEFKNVLIPFQPAERYGRSILENSSFLVSSAFPDKELHGNGFVARLSGSTAEFINMWLWMNVGQNPFIIAKDNDVVFKPIPVLPAWMFLKKPTEFDFHQPDGTKTVLLMPKNSYAFNFLGTTLIVYHNPGRKDTFSAGGVKPRQFKITDINAVETVIDADCLGATYAQQLREGNIRRMDILLG